MTVNLNFLGFSATEGLKPVDVKVTTYTLIVGGVYITDNSSGVTYTLPVSARLGTVFSIVGKTGSWTVQQNANQQVLLGSQSTTVGTSGSVSSTSSSDCAVFRCITAGSQTVWRIENAQGNLTLV